MAEESQRILLEIATPDGKALITEVDSVQVPGAEGEFGILVGHLPLLSALKPGLLRYVDKGKTRVAAVDIGYVEAGPGKVSVLTEGYVQPERIDADEVKLELAEAEKRIKEFSGIHEGAEYTDITRSLLWARARLESLE